MFAGAKRQCERRMAPQSHKGIVPNQAEPYHVPLRKIRAAAAGQVKRVWIPRMPFRVLEYLGQLSDREREVMDLVVTGLINKEIGVKLKLSEVTVKIYRSRVMQKMEAASFADLVRMADRVKPRG